MSGGIFDALLGGGAGSPNGSFGLLGLMGSQGAGPITPNPMMQAPETPAGAQAVNLPMISADVPSAPMGFAGTGVPQAGAATIPSMPMAGGGGAPGGSSYTSRVVGVESNGNDFAKNPRSSATGAGQFIDGTWLKMIEQYRPDLAGSMSRGQLLALRSDPALSREMVGRYGDENGAALRRAGLPDNDGTRYLSHFLGPGGARSVLSADPSLPIGQVLGASQIAANPHIRNMTAGGVADWAARKMGGGGGSVGNVAAAPAAPAPSMQRMPGVADPIGMSAGATAQRGGFGLGGIEAQGAVLPGQASTAPGLASLSAQPMTTYMAPAGGMGGIGGAGAPAATPQQPTPYGGVASMLRNVLGGQQGKGQQQGQAQGSRMAGLSADAPGGRAMSLGEAYKQFDPSQFFTMLRARGVMR